MRATALTSLILALCTAGALAQQYDASGNPPLGSGGAGGRAPGSVLTTLNGPASPSSDVDHDGTDLLVISAYDGQAKIYVVNDTTGAVIRTVPINDAGDFGCGWDGLRRLYLTSNPGLHVVKTFDGVNANPVSTFAVPGNPVGIAHDSRRDVYWVCDWTTNTVYSINPNTGAVITTYSTAAVGCTRPAGVGYDSGNDTIYVGGRDQNQIYGMNAANGALVCSFPAQDGGNNPQGTGVETARKSVWHSSWNSNRLYELEGCWGPPGPVLSASGSCPGPMTFTASGVTPNGNVAFVWGTAGTFTIPSGYPCAGIQLDLLPLRRPPPGYVVSTANASGVATASGSAPPAACGRVLMQALDLTTCLKSNVVAL